MSISRNPSDNVGEVLKAFLPDCEAFSLEKLDSGHINYTFLVTLAEGNSEKYVLQRLNKKVFPKPELIMANLQVLADHIDRRIKNEGEYFSDWRVVRPVSAASGLNFYIDRLGYYWRILNYVEGEIIDRVVDNDHAFEAGRALGLFHRLVSDLVPDVLADTLPGFHVTPKYLAEYDRLMVKIDTVDEEYCAGVIKKHRPLAPVLENALRKGLLAVRVIHGDPRLENILFDPETGRALSIIDLDTVKPGLLHHDIGDCLRSCCNSAGGKIDNLDAIHFDTGICSKLLEGYLAEMEPLLTDVDYGFIYPAVRLLAFELGLRFFTDHLAGDIYFKTDRRGQNLQRALAQFKLLESIEESADEIQGIIDKLFRMGRSGG